MMRFRLPFCFLLLAVIAGQQVSCTRMRTGNQIAATLDNVESYLNDRPDSALSVLRSVDTTALHTRGLRARAALLHQIALDKCYIDITSDSILSPAFWYLKHGTADQKLKTWYYRSVLARNGGNRDEEMSCLIRGERYIPKANDPLMAGFVYTAKRVLYLNLFDIDNAAVNAEKAVASFQETSDSGRYFNAVISLANLSNLQEDYSGAAALLDTLRRHWDVLSPLQKNKYYGVDLSYRIALGSKAEEELVEFIESYLAEVPLSSVNWETVARAYLQEKQPNNALAALEKSNPSRTPAEEIVYQNTKYKILQALGREEEALESFQAYSKLVDERTAISLSSKGRFTEVEEGLREKEKKGTRWIVILIAGLLTVVMITVIGGRVAHGRIRENERNAASLKRKLSESGRRIKALEKKAHQAQDEVERLKELLNNKSLPESVVDLIRKRVMMLSEYGVRILSGQEMKASTILHDQLQLDDRQQFIDDLYKQFECLYPGIAPLLTQRRLTGQEKECMLLLSLGLSIREIARFMKLSEKRCYNIRTSARQKLGLDKDARAFPEIFQEKYSSKR